ncbi:MAG: hypothetical protein NTW29_06085 [Bacteroidetes bacterium]|nr:hypothetical protein [Bacteroidota bacterium]
MNAAQIHLALNHAPLFLSLIGGLLLGWSAIRSNNTIRSLSLWMLVAAAICTIPVYFTGEGTEELVENLPGVQESAIEKHEQLATLSFIIIGIMGVISLLALWLKQNKMVARWATIFTLLLSLASFITMAQTAHQGGLIRHSEIQQGASNQSENATNEGKEATNGKEVGKEKDDD